MRKPLTVTLSVVCTLKGMLRWSIQRIKVMLLCIVYAMLFVDTVDTGFCGTYTALYTGVKTLLCIQWPQLLYISILSTLGTSISISFNAIYIKAVDTKHIHTFLPINFLNIQPIFNPQKMFESWDWGLLAIPPNTIYVDTVDTRPVSLMHSMLSMLTLSIQSIK